MHAYMHAYIHTCEQTTYIHSISTCIHAYVRTYVHMHARTGCRDSHTHTILVDRPHDTHQFTTKRCSRVLDSASRLLGELPASGPLGSRGRSGKASACFAAAPAVRGPAKLATSGCRGFPRLGKSLPGKQPSLVLDNTGWYTDYRNTKKPRKDSQNRGPAADHPIALGEVWALEGVVDVVWPPRLSTHLGVDVQEAADPQGRLLGFLNGDRRCSNQDTLAY